MPLTVRPPKLMSELMDETIKQARQDMSDARERFAKFEGIIESVRRQFPKDQNAEALCQMWTFAIEESRKRMQEHITLLEAQKVMAEKMEQGFGYMETKTNDTDALVKSMLGASEDTTEKEIQERAKESGDIYNDIARRKRGEKR